MSRQHHYYGANHLHYLTKSVYRRVRVFDSDRFRLNFVSTLDDLRAELGFRIIGYVLMPEHCHLLIWPSELANPSEVLQRLEDRTALFVLKNLVVVQFAMIDHPGLRPPLLTEDGSARRMSTSSEYQLKESRLTTPLLP